MNIQEFNKTKIIKNPSEKQIRKRINKLFHDYDRRLTIDEIELVKRGKL